MALLTPPLEPKDMAPPVPTDRRYILTEEHAKNWGPFVVDEQLYLFQDAQPFRICIFNLDHCDIIAEVTNALYADAIDRLI